MGVGNGGWGEGAWPSWIFKHSTNIVDRGLNVVFFALFLLFSAFFTIFLVFFPLVSLEDANSTIFRYFLLIFGHFSLPSLLKNFLPMPLTKCSINLA